MKLNESKTKLIIFNPYTTRQAIPFVSIVDGQPLQCVDTIRLLGVLIDSKLSWWPMIKDVEERVRKKVWTLVKMREVGASVEDLTTLYLARIRSSIEDSVQVYGCFISGVQSKRLEDLQSRCLQVILGSKSRSYRSNLLRLGLERLDTRRLDLLKAFAISSVRSTKHNWWYVPSHPAP